MTRLIVVHYVGLTALRERVFRLDFLAEKGVPVEYWDLSSLYGHARESRAIDRPYVRRFETWRAFDAALERPELADAVLVPTFGYEPKTFGVFRRFGRCRARLCGLRMGLLPSPGGTHIRRFYDDLRFLGDPAKVGHFLLKRGMHAARSFGWVRDIDLVFTAGDAAKEAAGGRPTVPVHHCDSDDWIETAATDRPLLPGKYAVFLDQFLVSHPDYAIEGVTVRMDADRFYGGLNRLFRRLEERHGLEVVVAAHPKAEYPRNPYDGRKIFPSATRELVRFAEFAVTSYSTSISYAVLARKPIVFYTTDQFASVHGALGMDVFPPVFASALGRTFVNIDHPADDDVRVVPADAALYAVYKYRYLVSRESEGMTTREIMLRFLSGRGRK